MSARARSITVGVNASNASGAVTAGVIRGRVPRRNDRIVAVSGCETGVAPEQSSCGEAVRSRLDLLGEPPLVTHGAVSCSVSISQSRSWGSVSNTSSANGWMIDTSSVAGS